MTLTQIDGWHPFQTYRKMERGKDEAVKSLSPHHMKEREREVEGGGETKVWRHGGRLSDWIQLDSVLESEK